LQPPGIAPAHEWRTSGLGAGQRGRGQWQRADRNRDRL